MKTSQHLYLLLCFRKWMKKPLRKSNFLTSSLKTPVVLAESLGFFVTVSLMFLFLHVFISSDVFGCFHCWLYLSISLFLHCCCYCECYGFERAFFTLRSFFSYTSSCFYQGFPGAGSSALKVAGSPTEVRKTDPAHLFVWITQYSAKGISR